MLLFPCAPQLHRAGPHCSPQSWGRTPPSSLLQQPQAWQDNLPRALRPCSRELVAKDSSMLQAGVLGLEIPLGCKAARGHPLPLDKGPLPHHAAQPHQRVPPKAGYIPRNVLTAPACPAQDGSIAQALRAVLACTHSGAIASRGPCPGRLLHPTRPFVKCWLTAKRNIF